MAAVMPTPVPPRFRPLSASWPWSQTTISTNPSVPSVYYPQGPYGK